MLQSTDIVFLSAMFLNFARYRLYMRLNIRDFEQIKKNCNILTDEFDF